MKEEKMSEDRKQISKIRRIAIIMIVLWIPISIMLSMIGMFGDYGGDEAVIFWFAGEIFWIILAIFGPWVGKAFR
tara:strand:- start:198 stop:422 length:225 start_codon:yes stop_codon:yes gene_type:complete